MNILRQYSIFIFLGYMIIYFAWLYFWHNVPYKMALGSDILLIISSAVSAILLFYAFKKSKEHGSRFWLFLSLGALSYTLANIIWSYYELVLKKNPFPGYADFFYAFVYVLYLIAFACKMYENKGTYQLIRLIFDLLIVMTVTISLIWEVIIEPLLLSGKTPVLNVLVSTVYPVGDLTLIFSVFCIYLVSKDFFANRVLMLICMGFFLEMVADAVYLYLQALGSYVSGSYIDPLWGLALLLIGFASIYRDEQNVLEPRITASSQGILDKDDRFKLLLPYLSILLLLVIVIWQRPYVKSTEFGLIITILLVIVRQISTLLENKSLLNTLQLLNMELKKKSEEDLQNSEQRFKSLVDSMNDIVFMLDCEGRFMGFYGKCIKEDINQENSGTGINYHDILGVDNILLNEKAYKNAIAGENTVYEWSTEDALGIRFYQISLSPIKNSQDKIVGVVGVGRDITQLKQMQEQLEYISLHDSLTGLYNRKYFEEEKSRLGDGRNAPVGIIVCDMDGLKETNDALGHQTGDKLIKAAATLLKGCFRQNDVIARIGGDEFAIIMSKCTRSIVKDSCIRIQKLITLHNIEHPEMPISMSIGFSVSDKEPANIDYLFLAADRNMYEYKKSKKSPKTVLG